MRRSLPSWSTVNDAAFAAVVVALVVAGVGALAELVGTSGLGRTVAHLAQLSLVPVAAGAVVSVVRVVRARARPAVPVLVGALVPVAFLGAVVLATPPFTGWSFTVLLLVLASRLGQLVRDRVPG